MLRWSALLVVPLLGVVAGAPVADAWGARIGARLSTLASALPRAESKIEADETEPVAIDAPRLIDPSLPESIAAPKQKKAPARGKAPAKQAPATRSIYVRKETVLALAERGVRPSGKPVRASAGRPAGLLLSGVTALGVGLADGDVLTEVEGRPALAPGKVIEAVLAARARRASVISGVFYRGEQRWLVAVEQPYLPERPLP